jgi:hypothetical protein
VSILNKQLRTADRGLLSSLEVGRWAKSPHRMKSVMLRNVSKRLGPGLILWHDL